MCDPSHQSHTENAMSPADDFIAHNFKSDSDEHFDAAHVHAFKLKELEMLLGSDLESNQLRRK